MSGEEQSVLCVEKGGIQSSGIFSGGLGLREL